MVKKPKDKYEKYYDDFRKHVEEEKSKPKIYKPEDFIAWPGDCDEEEVAEYFRQKKIEDEGKIREIIIDS